MAVGTLDQHQDSIGASFGFGEAAGTKYRGQTFTAGLSGRLGSIGFNRDKGSQGIKVYIDTASANVPDHAVGSELYSFEITNANVIDGYGVYDLPIPLAGITASTKYCFYLAPWNTTTHTYSDDYHDCHGITGGGVEITGSPGFSNENLTFNYATYVVTSTAYTQELTETLTYTDVLDTVTIGHIRKLWNFLTGGTARYTSTTGGEARYNSASGGDSKYQPPTGTGNSKWN